jgi:hypothetical protein
MRLRDVLGIAAVVLAFIALVTVAGRWHQLHRSGRAERAHFTGDGRVIVVDSTRAATTRARVHDGRTGVELARAILGDCLPAAAGFAWCDGSDDEGVSLRRLDTLAVVADQARLRALAPGLAQAPAPRTQPAVDPDDGALLELGSDGRGYRITSDLTARVEERQRYFLAQPSPTLHFDEGRRGTTDKVSLGDNRVRLVEAAGGWRNLVVAPITDPRAPYLPGAKPAPPPVVSERKYLDAGLVADPDSGRALHLGSPQGAVMAFVEIEKGGRRLLLGRVDGNGSVSWATPAGFDEQVLGGGLVGDTAVVVLRSALIGLDAATGALRYRQDF